MTTLPDFSLAAQDGSPHRFPAGGPTLLAFVKDDCPTCAVAAPLLGVISAAVGDRLPVLVIAQDAAGPSAFGARLPAAAAVLDDSALQVSFDFDIDTVPTLVLADGEGVELQRIVGFDRDEWQALVLRLAEAAGQPQIDVRWEEYPAFRPGCGSRSVEPGIAERLAADASGSPLRARRIEIGSADDPFEFMFDQGLTDGLPVVPPTPERVLRMLSGTKREAGEVLAAIPPNYASLTVEKAAINAVMAGCRPEYFPVVIAAIQAVCTEQFNMHGVLATTHFPGPVIIVNGPIRRRIGMNMRFNVLGPGNRANATIGRAVQLIVRNVGGGRPGEVDRAALGQPGKYTFCFAEFEERSNWPPLHVERGFQQDESTVTVYAGGAPTAIVDQLSRDARSLATSYGLALATAGHPKHYFHGEIVVVVPPEHVDTFASDGWTKDQVREQIQRASLRPARELVRGEGSAEGITMAQAERIGFDTPVPKFRDPAQITLVVAGGPAGKFGAYLGGWISGPAGSSMTTRRIED